MSSRSSRLLPSRFTGVAGSMRKSTTAWRMLAFKDGSRVRLVSRNGRDHTHCFSDIAAAVAKLPASTLILDGEVVRFDDQLISRFFLLSDAPEDALVTPPLFMA